MQKGLSPLVATVLLIAVTMTIAGIIAYWASTFTRSGLPSENKTASLQSCTGADFTIYYQSYNSTTERLVLVLQNTGPTDLTITNITFLYPDGALDSKTISSSLSQGSLKSFIITNITSGYKSYTVFTQCPNVYRRYP